MTDQQKRELLYLVGFVAVMGTLVIAVVSALLARWRRSLLSGGRNGPSADTMPDLWKVGGQRLTRQMDAGDDDDVNPFDSGDGDAPDDPDDRDGPGPGKRGPRGGSGPAATKPGEPWSADAADEYWTGGAVDDRDEARDEKKSGSDDGDAPPRRPRNAAA